MSSSETPPIINEAERALNESARVLDYLTMWTHDILEDSVVFPDRFHGYPNGLFRRSVLPVKANGKDQKATLIERGLNTTEGPHWQEIVIRLEPPEQEDGKTGDAIGWSIDGNPERQWAKNKDLDGPIKKNELWDNAAEVNARFIKSVLDAMWDEQGRIKAALEAAERRRETVDG